MNDSASRDNASCSQCGRPFHCAIDDEHPCWCATEFPPVVPLPEASGGCLCPDCLRGRIANRDQEGREIPDATD